MPRKHGLVLVFRRPATPARRVDPPVVQELRELARLSPGAAAVVRGLVVGMLSEMRPAAKRRPLDGGDHGK